REVLKRNGSEVLALNNLAFLLALRSGKADEALRLLDRAVEVKGPHPDLLDTRAVVLLSARRTDEAIRELTAAIKEAPTAVSYFPLAQALDLKGDKAQARVHLGRAEELGLTEADLHPLERPAYRRLKGPTGG